MNDLAKNLLLWIVIAIVLVSVFNNFTPPRTPAKTIEYSEFVRSVKEGVVSEVLIEGRSIHGRTTSNENFSTYSPGDPKLVDDLLNHGVRRLFPRSGLAQGELLVVYGYFREILPNPDTFL